MRALAVVCALSLPAAADDTFEAKAGAAHRVDHVEDIVWTVTASCDKGDDVAQRQCRKVRESRAAALAGQTFVVEGDPDAFEVGTWNAAKKSVTVKLAGCVRCGGVAIESSGFAGARSDAQRRGDSIDGKTWYVAGAASAPRFEGGKLRTNYLYDTARVFPDEAAAKAWLDSIKKVRVQLIVKVPDKPRWAIGGKDGVALEIVGYRVFAACNGAIVAASPASGAAAPDRKSCSPAAPSKAS